MGPSGAGKTTLLKCLNGRKLNKLSPGSKIFTARGIIKTCFIKQDIYEHLLEGLTVRQTLLYASKLKNSRILKKLDHKQIVSDLMEELLISDTADNRVESCSGGEQKRVIVCAELTAHIKPEVLLIDEPTSGLDSNGAEVVIRCLKRLSRIHDMTVITSIHQPNQDLFLMFDSVYVLAKGGVCVYSGPPTALKQHMIYCNIECDENQIPIEVILKLCSEDTESEAINSLKEKTEEKNKALYEKCLTQKMRLMCGQTNISKRFSFKNFYQLLWRTMTYTYKCQWKTCLLQFSFILLCGLVLKFHFSPEITSPDGCIILELGSGCDETPTEIHNNYLIKQNIKYNILLIFCLSSVILIVMSITFSTDYKVCATEHRNGNYYYCYFNHLLDHTTIFEKCSD